MRGPISGTEWLKRYKHVSGIKLKREPHNADESLALCFDLSVDALFSGKTDDKLLYYALGAFPDDTQIPENVVLRLWRQIDPSLTEDAFLSILQEMADIALVDVIVNKTSRSVSLHDLLRDYCRDMLDRRRPEVHRKLLSSYNPDCGPWHQVADDGYIYANLAYHLIEADEQDCLRSALLDFDWIMAKLRATGVVATIADYDAAMTEAECSDPKSPLNLVRSAIQLSAHVLANNPGQLWYQLYGRLMNQPHRAIQGLLDRPPAGYRLRPVALCLLPPGTALRQTLAGHKDSICCVAVSPCGRIGLTASYDGTIKVWDLARSMLSESLQEHLLAVTALAIQGDGKRALSGSVDQRLILWDLEIRRFDKASKPESGSRGILSVTLNKVLQPRSGAGSVLSVAVDHTGDRAISGHQDGSLFCWDLRTGQATVALAGHRGAVVSAAMSPDGRWGLTGSYDRTAMLWDLDVGEPVRTFSGHAGPVLGVALGSRDGRPVVVSASADYTIRFWDPDTGDQVRQIESHHGSWVRAVTLPKAGDALISGNYRGQIQFWNLDDGGKLREIQGHASGHRSGRHLGSLDDGGKLREIQGHGRQILAIAANADGTVVLSGGTDCSLKVWDMTIREDLPSFLAPGIGIFALAYQPRPNRLLTTHGNHTIRVWDPSTRSVVRTLEGHRNTIMALALSPDGRRAVSGSFDRSVRVWDVDSGETLNDLTDHPQLVTSVAISPRGDIVASGTKGSNQKESLIRLWDLSSGETIKALEGHKGDVNSLTFSPDGRYLLSGSDDHSVRLWDVQDGREIRTLKGHTDIVKSVVFSRDGKTAVSAGCDHTILVWDVDSGDIRRTLRGHKDYIWTVH